MTGALTLLITSPRLPAGVLTRDAWRVLEAADHVLALDIDDPTPAALIANGVSVQAVRQHGGELARTLVARSASGSTVWVGSPDADPGLTDALAEELTRLVDPPEVEVLVGSWDPPGARLLDAVAVMDTLRSPDGCPWDAEQTHESLTPYLVEEAYETVEAIEHGDLGHLSEELGDVLLQVLFHARIGQEHPHQPFDIDDVAHALVAKLLRRHPHVFADGDASSPAEVEQAWEQIKAAEKPDRDTADLLSGIPGALPPRLVVEKVRARLRRRGGDPSLDAELVALTDEYAAAEQLVRERLRAVLAQHVAR